MHEYYELVSQGAPPLTLSDIKCNLKITNNKQDSLLLGLLNAATEYGEKYTRRSFRDQTWNLKIDQFCDDSIDIRRSPVNSVIDITYLEDDNTTVGTVDNTIYYLIEKQQISQIWLDAGESWPSNVSERKQSVTVQFTTVLYSKCNESIKTALNKHIAHMYFNRGDCDDCGNSSSSNVKTAGAASGADAIYDQFRVSRV